MATIEKEVTGTLATLMSTELPTLASGSAVVSSVIAGTGVYDNTVGNAPDATHGDGYEFGIIAFIPGAAFAGNPTANTGLDVYFLKSFDGGTTFEGGSATVIPSRLPDVTLAFPGGTATAADNTVVKRVALPGCKFKVLLKNNGTGQALPTGSTLKMLPATPEGV